MKNVFSQKVELIWSFDYKCSPTFKSAQSGYSPSKRSAIAKLSKKALKAVLILRLIAKVAMTSRLPGEIIRKKWSALVIVANWHVR